MLYDIIHQRYWLLKKLGKVNNYVKCGCHGRVHG
jgi:hypothetical protein